MHDKWTNADLVSLIGSSNYTRRQILVTSLAAGFAMAVQPVCAETMITTDTEGLTAGEVRVPVADGDIIAEVGGGDHLVLRGSNGSFTCSIQDGGCGGPE